MRSFPQPLLFLLLLAMCGLCSVQWWRESQLRETANALRLDLARSTAECDKVNERAKAADGEILRLNSAINELRVNSVAKADLDAALDSASRLREQVQKANQAITQQQSALEQQGAAIQKTNDTIKKTADERDDLARKANEITLKYNALVKKLGGGT